MSHAIMSDCPLNKLEYKFGKFSVLWLLLCLFSLPSLASPEKLSQQPMIHKFIKMMVKKHGFNKSYLDHVFNKVVIDKPSLKSISKPYEKRSSWHHYHHFFLKPKRIKQGVYYWQQHTKTLMRAEKIYGVPADIIVAILGIETFYGKRMGAHKALDALTTLAFKYPQRASFFLSELESYLLLTRKAKADPNSVLASYAGALGQCQFMPSSYLAYAVDFSGDGYADLFTNAQDSIGSIANYLKKKGWRHGQPIVVRAKVTGERYLAIAKQNMGKVKKPKLTLKEIAKYGIKPVGHYPDNLKANFMVLEGKNGKEFWLGFYNFYVITRYNSSKLYAMATYELGRTIEKAVINSKMQSA